MPVTDAASKAEWRAKVAGKPVEVTPPEAPVDEPVEVTPQADPEE